MPENIFRLSVSKTKTFLQCAKQYEFAYIYKMPKKDWDHHILGKFCHKVLEEFHNAYIVRGSEQPFNIEMSNSFKTALLEYKNKMSPAMRKECWDIINQYLKIVTDEKKNNLSANVLACEKSFELNIENKIVLNGMIDRIQLDDDNVIHVCDYKTVKNKKYLKNDFFQLLTYAYVIIADNPEITKVRASYILLRHDFEYITAEFNIPEIMTVKDKYLEYAEKIQMEKQFNPSPSALCNFCDFLDSCPEGKSKSFGQNVYGEVSW